MPFPSTSSATSNHRVRVGQATADAGLHLRDSADAFDNSRSVGVSTAEPHSAQEMAYVQNMQRGCLTQTFGCMVAVEELRFRVIAYSANAAEFLDLMPHAGSSMWETDMLSIGTDLRTLFTPSSVASLEKAAATQDVGLLNPITVHCRRSGKALYAIAHRIDVGMVIDFEAVEMGSVPVSVAGALQSHNLAAKAISRLQALPGGDIALLCDTVVEEVQKLTGYDRVMAYKFHEDEHGEVVAEMRRTDLPPYFGLHYPATNIPRASRSLLMTNRVRMVGDCRAPPVRVIQDPNMKQFVSLAGSTLRAPNGCHAQYMGSMGSIASLVMSVIINDDGKRDDSRETNERGRKLWGLVVCHHTTPRAVPYSIRSACEFLMQVFGVQLNMEVELAPKLRERHILRTQTLLCDMLLQDAPTGIVCQSPNIMDLVNCDGAALYYGKRFWLLGTTPTENQIADIAKWLLECHEDSTGLSTDSLADASYPGADLLDDAVCGMAAARITAKDFLFWFRSATAEDIKWGGAEHDSGGIDGGRQMHPIVKRSLPWDEVEMGAIHSLQLMLRRSFQDIGDSDTKTMIHARLNDLKLRDMDELSVVANDMGRLIETATAPILAVDSTGIINGWNAKIAQVTGLPVSEAKGCSLLKDLVLDESVVVVERLLRLASRGEEEQNVEIKLKTFGAQKEKGAVILIVNACSSRDVSENVVGVCFVGQDVTGQKMFMDRFSRIQGDYETIVQNPHPLIPPIFGCDEYGYCFEWNPAMEGLTGWKRDDVVGKFIVGEIFGMQRMCCRMKSQDAMTKFMKSLNNAIDGLNTDKVSLSFFDREGNFVETLLSTSKRTDANGVITGVFCFLQSGDKAIVQSSYPLVSSSVDGDEFVYTFASNSAMGGFEDCATGSVGRLDVYLKRAEECMEVVEKMPSPRFNNEQCQYLVDKLKAVVQSARLFLEVPHAKHHLPGPSRHG